MDLAEILTLLQREYEALQAADDKRKHSTDRAGDVFDTYIQPIDLPINDIIEDAIVDPAARQAFLAMAGILFDAIAKRLSDGESIGWPSLVAPTTGTPKED